MVFSLGKWINILQYIYTMEHHYSNKKQWPIDVRHTTPWMKLNYAEPHRKPHTNYYMI
jgi:hypothetical protein